MDDILIFQFFNLENFKNSLEFHTASIIEKSLLLQQALLTYEHITDIEFKNETSNAIRLMIKASAIERYNGLMQEINGMQPINDKVKYLSSYIVNYDLNMKISEIEHPYNEPNIFPGDPFRELLSAQLEVYKLQNNNYPEDSQENNYPIPIDIKGQERFVYCHKFGIINYLKELIISDGRKYSDAQLYKYLALITNTNEKSIQKYMGFSNRPDSSTDHNPFKNVELMDRVTKMILNNSMITKV